MRTELIITPNPIDELALANSRRIDRETGAVISFLGVVRATENESKIAGLEYEAFEAMARRQFELIFQETGQRWPLFSIRLVHRIGPVQAGQPSLWLEVTAGHRQEAFAAAQSIVDRMKQIVPIWKKPIPES